MRVILYLHGFRSSPRSVKARQLARRLDERGLGARYRCPQLSVSPRVAAQEIAALVRAARDEPLAIIGSSLGGYYATWIAERTDSRVVLLNPAVHPERDLAQHLGVKAVYHSDETVDIEPEFLDELAALRTGPITRPDRYLLVAATGDEVLDWREMVARYPGAHHQIVQGSDHGLSDFRDHIDDVIDFALDLKADHARRRPVKESTMQVKLIERRPVRVACLRHVGPYGQAISEFWRKTFHPWLESQGLRGRAMYGISHDDPGITAPDECRYDAGVEVPDDFVATGAAHVTTIPGGRYAASYFFGPGAKIGEAWDALLRDWLPSSGLELDARPRFEYYPVDMKFDDATGGFECELTIPVVPS